MKQSLAGAKTVYEIADLIRATPQVVRRAIYAGDLTARKFGGKTVRIMPEDLNRWIEKCAQPTKPKKSKKLQEATK